ncbi:MAG: HEAT repeat domain-containing protein, partial [Phycisphaerae bacterium]|nr:HEAT repeat domain-containing protein [Phycisphaerae bacterium]
MGTVRGGAFAGTTADHGEFEGCECLEHRLEWAKEQRELAAGRTNRAGSGSRAAAPGEGRGGAFDATLGADHRNFPPDPLVTYLGMVLDIRVPDLAVPGFTAVQTLTVQPIGVPVPALRLDAEGLDIKQVTVDGAPAEWSYDGHVLAIRFAEPLPAKATVIQTTYECARPVRGMTFSPATPAIEGVAPARAAELHTQGQTETNHHWFPIHDSPNVRLPTELLVNVPKGVVVSGNGELIRHETVDDREVWQWRQQEPHVPYLVSLVAGGFERVELPNPKSGVPMAVWLVPGRADDARATYANTDAMIALFERRFGVKYPWARYDQLVVRNFGSGGMENTSATSMHPAAIFDATARADGDMDGLIAHELCHQWTGDLITCKSWEHIWLNEGWATYGSTLWNEERDGVDGYYDSVLSSAGVARRDTPEAPEAMCSPVWGNAGETFGRAANPYPKGASILHMLRRMLGDEIFFKGVRNYMQAHAGGLVETSDFRYAMEAASGLGLEWFFDQWCDRPGSPRVKATAAYDAATRTLTVSAEQTQTIDARTPALRISMPVWVKTAHGERVVPFDMRNRTARMQVVLDGPPQAVWIDPWLDALKTLEVDQPAEWTLAVLKSGPTIAAKRQAMATLGKTDTPEARAALVQVASDAALRHSLRAAAVETLAAYGSPEAKVQVLSLFDAGCADPKVRTEQIQALATCAAADATPRLTAL